MKKLDYYMEQLSALLSSGWIAHATELAGCVGALRKINELALGQDTVDAQSVLKLAQAALAPFDAVKDN